MKKSLLSCLVALMACFTAHATTVLSDSFTYADGPIEVGSGSPWVIHSGATPANISTNQLRLTGGNTADVNASLSGGPYLSNSPAVLYSSFKMRVTSKPGNAGTYLGHFKDTNSGIPTGFGGRVFVASSNAYTATLLTDPQQYRVGIGNGTSGTAASGQIDQTLFLNTNYIVVTRFVPNTGIATIWLNPVAESDPSVTATDLGTPARPNAIDVVSYAFRQASGMGVVVVDDLRVGTTFADVAGANNPPSITPIAAQNIPAGGSTASLPFTIGDAETAAGSLTVSGTSTNTTLVPNANIVFGGSDSNRTVTITPAPAQQGTTLITISVTDAGGAISAISFRVSVGVPTISDIPNQTTPSNTVLGSISFTVNDTETPNSLTVTATSGNQTLLPDANITVSPSGTTRTITITPAPDQVGVTTVTVTVSDGMNSASDTFVLTVNPLIGIMRSDDFNRPNGPLVALDGNWLSNGGTGGTNGQQMQIVNNKVRVTESESEDVSTEIPANSAATYAPSSGMIFYVAMKVTLTALPNSAGTYFAHFRDSGNGFRCRIWVATSGAAPGTYRVGIVNAAASIAANQLIPTDLALNQTHLLVARYNVGTGECKLWLNPASEGSAASTASDAPQTLTVEAFTFRSNAGEGTVCVDDLKIGTSFTDVVQAAPALTISATGNNVTISWPTTAGYVLLFTDSFPAAWADFVDQGTPQGNLTVVTINGVSDSRFFELRKP